MTTQTMVKRMVAAAEERITYVHMRQEQEYAIALDQPEEWHYRMTMIASYDESIAYNQAIIDEYTEAGR